MSSSGYHPPPHLHRVNVHPHGKRPFEECGGYDSDPDTSMPVHSTPSGTSSSSSNNRCPAPASPTAPHNPEARNKRARSTSSTSTDDSSSHPSSSGYNTAQSSSRSDIFDGPSALPVNPVDCPIHPAASPPSFVSARDVHMSDLHLPIPPTQPQHNHVPAPPTQEDTLRTSLQRFAEFDRQIAALRTSLAATRPSPMPSLGPSVDGDQITSDDHWHTNSSNFLPSGSSSLPPSTATDPASSVVAVAPSETLNSLSTFASSNDSAHIAVATSIAPAGVPSTSFTPTYGNVSRYPPYPSYRHSSGGSSLLAEPVGDAISVTSTPAFMRPSSNGSTARPVTRSLVSVESPAPPSTSHIRHLRRSLSPLVFSSDPSPSSPPSLLTDDILVRYRALFGDGDPANGGSHRRSVDSSVQSLDHGIRFRPEDHLNEQPRGLSQSRFDDRARVIREHSIERESVPSVFDVFNIGESSLDRSRPAPIREPAAPRFTSIAEPVPPRGPGTHDGRSRGPAPISTAATTNQVPSQDLHSRVHSSWTSIPSSNSLMSESASERRHALALERFRARLRRSSFDADDESDSRWSGSSRGERESGGDLRVISPVPPSPSVESAPGTSTSSHFPLLSAAHAPPSTTNRVEQVTSTSLQHSFSELFDETQMIAREEGAWLLDWDALRAAERERLLERGRERERQLDRDRQRERVLEWERERERQRERSSQDVRGRSFTFGASPAPTSSAREGSSHSSVPAASAPPRPFSSQLGSGSNTMTPNTTSMTLTNNSQQYSYSSLNLSSFQSGLFRDSLRRNVEVDQASFSTSGPAIPPPASTGDSRTASRLGFDDSGSEMDLDDFVRTRPPSPEWSRPQPYAGRTPPPDHSPPPRNFSLRPGFSVLRRRSMINFESPARSQHPNRNTTIFTRPMPPTPGSTRPIPYENNNQPAPSERTERDRFLPARILESFYRSHEDGRRNPTVGTDQPYHPPNQSHPLMSSSVTVSRNERNDVLGGPRSVSGNGNGSRSGNRPRPEVVGENRRSSLGLGGSIRSRLARFANSQSSSTSADVALPSQPRSPPRPIGARPQVAEQRRRGSLVFGNASILEHESRPGTRSVSGPPHWVVSSGAVEPPAVARDAPWRAPSGSRNVFVPPSPASGPARAEVSEVASRVEDQRSRLRTLRQRLQLDRGEGVRVFRTGMLRAAMGRRGNMGDYVPDELFDDSYEALLSLSSMLGEVRSKATPDEVIASLPTGTFKDWKKEDSESRCPICLDDYEPSDILAKLIECPHWLHKHCLEQWLRTANTCPVCREEVKASPKPAPARRRPYRDSSGSSEPNQGASGSTSGRSPSSRPTHTTPQTNIGRPASFATMVFDRLMSDGRVGTSEPWPSSSPQVPQASRDARSVYLERLRAQQQQLREPHHTHEAHIEFPPPHELPYHLRVLPSSQPGLSSRQTAGGGLGGTDGSGMRPLGFVSPLRGQGSDSSMSTSSSMSMVIDEAGSSGRRSMASTSGGAGSSSGSLFLDGAMMPRRETVFPFVPPSSGAFTGAGGSAAPPPLPPLLPQQQPSFDARPPTVVISNSTEPSRDWRGARGYDPLFNTEASRSSSLSSQARPMSMANRIPVEEDSSFEDPVFGWNVYGRRLGHAYPSSFGEESARRPT